MKKLLNHVVPVARLFRDGLWGDPVKDAYDKVQEAMKLVSRRMAEAEYHKLMANFHTERVMTIDPHKHWWEFATAKQGQVDHQADWDRENQKAEEARASLAARSAQYERLWSSSNGVRVNESDAA